MIKVCEDKDCQLLFITNDKRRKYCSRDCYRYTKQQDSIKSHRRIWFNGKREYLHRIVYMTETGEKLTSDDIIHHINGNKFDNRFENLQKLTGRAAHLHCHNYHKKDDYQFDEDFPF